VVAALTACLLADGFWYRVGRRGWSKSHRFCRPKSNWKNRVVSLIGRHSGASMLLAKFVVGSNVVSLLSGQTGLSAARFLIYDSMGSLVWSGSYIALGYLVHGQLHWTLPQALRPLLVVRAAVFPGRFCRRRTAYAAMLVLATIFFCALQPVSQHNAGIGEGVTGEEERHAIECKETHGLIGAGSRRAYAQKRRVLRNTGGLRWITALFIAIARWL
jgi:membrane protein DedA with SNARE-associated domain